MELCTLEKRWHSDLTAPVRALSLNCHVTCRIGRDVQHLDQCIAPTHIPCLGGVCWKFASGGFATVCMVRRIRAMNGALHYVSPTKIQGLYAAYDTLSVLEDRHIAQIMKSWSEPADQEGRWRLKRGSKKSKQVEYTESFTMR